MGSQLIQGKLWGQKAKDWAEIQESTSKPCYDYVLSELLVTVDTSILDIGCGSGFFCKLAYDQGAKVQGIDASTELMEKACERVPDARFVVGEMEELPYEDEAFDVVTAFNSFQYAANTANAINEAKRVLKEGGYLVAMVWGNKEECEALSYLKAVGSLLPQPPPGAPGPFALSENQLLEKNISEAGLNIVSVTDMSVTWDYPNLEMAMKGLMSAGPVARAVDNSGFETAYRTILDAVKPFARPEGNVVYNNKFRIVISQK